VSKVEANFLILRPSPMLAPIPGTPILQLRECSCRWPLGGLREPAARFCGGRKIAGGSPYCAEHTDRALATAERRPLQVGARV
jgi:GcrA cell cycle regulator